MRIPNMCVVLIPLRILVLAQLEDTLPKHHSQLGIQNDQIGTGQVPLRNRTVWFAHRVDPRLILSEQENFGQFAGKGQAKVGGRREKSGQVSTQYILRMREG
jgi:hypothetical protein